MMKHTLAVLFENRLNAIPRITGLFDGRGFAIDSISFGPGEDPGLTRMTVTTRGEEPMIEQITKQLYKLVDVTKVIDLTHDPFVERELALVKVNCTSSSQAEILQLVNVFRAKVVDLSPWSLTVEVTGREDKVDAAVGLLAQYGILELSRTGSIALKREYKKETGVSAQTADEPAKQELKGATV